jgi:hypothetical protein
VLNAPPHISLETQTDDTQSYRQQTAAERRHSSHRETRQERFHTTSSAACCSLSVGALIFIFSFCGKKSIPQYFNKYNSYHKINTSQIVPLEASVIALKMSHSLREMNEKERQKEFKRICKDLKSKDLPVREAALKTVLQEPAYLIDGRGICALLEGVSAKKVT